MYHSGDPASALKYFHVSLIANVCTFTPYHLMTQLEDMVVKQLVIMLSRHPLIIPLLVAYMQFPHRQDSTYHSLLHSC